ncbi:MAG: hypothetical protein ABIM20_05250 [candidate division WOR-3 bacterium]
MTFFLLLTLLCDFYDPIFQKDLSLDLLAHRCKEIKAGSGSYINFYKPELLGRPSVVFSPELKLLGFKLPERCYLNSYLDLIFKLGIKTKDLSFFAKVDFFNFKESYKFPGWHPLSDASYFMYSFDEQPIIGGKSILDINLREAYLSYDNNEFNLLVGRANIRIGEGLLFSGNSYPLDYIYRVSFKLNNLKILSAFAVPVDTFLRRTISYQVLEWTPLPNLVFTLYEAVSHSEEDLFKYFNPITLYYERQRRGKSNSDNLLGGIALRYIFKSRTSVFIDVLNDDIVIFQGGTSKYAILAGFEALKSPNEILRFSSVFIPRFTYTHVSDTNGWNIMGIPIGYPRGNDLVDFYFSYFRNLSEDNSLIFRVAYLNKGEGTLFEKWEESGFPRNMPFPSGKVRRDLVLMAGLKKKFFYFGSIIDLVYKGKDHALGVFLNFGKDLFRVVF